MAAIVAIAGWRFACSRSANRPADWSSAPLVEGEFEVLRVLAADELELLRRSNRHGNRVRVKLLGVDSPRGAATKSESEFTKDFLAGGACRLEFDKRRIDREGAYLAYVFVGDELLNEQLVRAGLARVAPKPDDSPPIARRLAQAEAEAQAAARGLWATRVDAGERKDQANSK